MKIQAGRCQCGEIQYESKGTPIGLYICHCRECQKQSSSAFGITVEVPREGFQIKQGHPKYWSRPTDGGRSLQCAFCPTCGTRLWHEYDTHSETISIKGGSFDSPIDVSNAIHVWVTRKLPGIIIPEDAKQLPED